MNEHKITRVSFDPGRLVMTRAAAETFDPYEVWRQVTRHLRCDWGDVCAADWRANDEAVQYGDRIVSRYQLDAANMLIITEADRTATTVMRADDY